MAQLEGDGHKCTSIQGGMEHSARDRVIEEFRSGTTKILIATDVLSRGFDVTQVGSIDLHSTVHNAYFVQPPQASQSPCVFLFWGSLLALPCTLDAYQSNPPSAQLHH